jgi:phosphonate transport system ATP-binding protein
MNTALSTSARSESRFSSTSIRTDLPTDRQLVDVPSNPLGGLAIHGLSMQYPNGHTALRHVDMQARPGKLTVLLGANGCGKSTLMKCIVGLLHPTSGSVQVAGRDLSTLSGEVERQARLHVALISQKPNLVGRRSVLSNVCSGSLGRHRTWSTALGAIPRSEVAPALGYLDEVGLAHLAHQRADTLSGGQAQRVSVARALAQRPLVLLADEPLASLDPEAANDLMRLLRRLANEDMLAIVCILHQPEIACHYADRLVGLNNGQVAFDGTPQEIPAGDIAALYRKEAQ